MLYDLSLVKKEINFIKAHCYKNGAVDVCVRETEATWALRFWGLRTCRPSLNLTQLLYYLASELD